MVNERENASAPPAVDTGWFDGSADPNPGGRLGMGWHFALSDGTTLSGRDERPADPSNTNNVGEYSALIHLLEAYIGMGREGPLLVQGDSELIIRQMAGEYAVRSPGLFALNERASALAGQIAGGVRFRWIRREQNRLADALASGKTLAQAQEERDPARFVYARTPPPEGAVAAALAQSVAALNAQGTMSFKEGMRLRTGGSDAFSAVRGAALAERVGAEGMARIAEAFAGETDDARKQRESAARWTLRGLAVHLAIGKAQIDAEINANMRTRQGG